MSIQERYNYALKCLEWSYGPDCANQILKCGWDDLQKGRCTEQEFEEAFVDPTIVEVHEEMLQYHIDKLTYEDKQLECKFCPCPEKIHTFDVSETGRCEEGVKYWSSPIDVDGRMNGTICLDTINNHFDAEELFDYGLR